jgi:ferredoxin
MADHEHVRIGDSEYAVPVGQKPRKKAPPYIVVMNDNCTCCSGSPMCMPECPVDCIHFVYGEGRRPERVYVDNEVCIGCLNCFSWELRPKDVNKGDKRENLRRFNSMDLMEKKAVCPWDAIEVHLFDEGAARSREYYEQPKESLAAQSASAPASE